MRFTNVCKRLLGGLLAVGLLIGLSSHAQEPTKPKFRTKITDGQEVVVDVESSGPIDPTQRINFDQQQGFPGFYINIRTSQNQTLHLSHFPSFMINGRFHQQAGGGRFEVMNARLPKTGGGKERVGYYSVLVIDNLKITQTLELHPSKSKGAGQKRLMNTVLVSYLVENKGMQPAQVGVRTYMDTYVINNDGCLFASPVTHPNKILDGIVLEGKTLPPYFQMLQVPNLAAPGYIAHLTLDVGSKFEKGNKVVLTRHGQGFAGWDMQAVASMGDSGMGLYWPVKELNAGAKREVAYAYGEGIAVGAGSEGRFQLELGGSFEPGKLFTVSATVGDPAIGQTLSLELPKGIERIEGKEVQPVAPLSENQEYSTVLWKARVQEPGEYTLRIRSSTGVTQTKVISVTAAK
jgi:hypothetical protein